MSYRTYIPKRGDLVHMNFSPSTGHELADRHYALVISQHTYSKKSGMAIVCGITSHLRGWPFEVLLPAGLLPDKKGAGPAGSVILADAVRQIDYRQREMEFVATCPREVVEDVLDKLYTITEE
ncbi:MAG: type II toxin-antitoxin system PemK/MazF family toxin [Tepidisphaerales bacterium]